MGIDAEAALELELFQDRRTGIRGGYDRFPLDTF